VITGERAVTGQGAFNPSWQRHLSIYGLVAPLFGPGLVLDLGCGIGQGQGSLAPRPSVGVDVEASVLAGQGRPVVRADMRRLPLREGSFPSIVASHSVEHVPDPERVVSEVARTLADDGLAVFATPNRLTFGRPDEIIDPYHFIEFDPAQFRSLCRAGFADVEVLGLFGSARYMEFFAKERCKLGALLRMDPLRLRRLASRRVRQLLYDLMLTRSRREAGPVEASIGPEDFRLDDTGLDEALDLVALCRRPVRPAPR
jgi:SAM-dependent methyltransferase